jgi:hypothetical protein
MSKDLDLRLRLTATDKNVAGTVRSTKREVQGLNDTLGATSRRTRGTTSGFSGLTTAGDEATRMFKLQKGSLQQAGFQFQDLAVQIGSGTSAFVAIGQQGSQLLSILGPGGALLGAVVAIGSVFGGLFFSGTEKAAEGAKTLREEIEELEGSFKDLTSAQKEALRVELAQDQADRQKQIEAKQKQVDTLRREIEEELKIQEQAKSLSPNAFVVTGFDSEEVNNQIATLEGRIDTLSLQSDRAKDAYNDLINGVSDTKDVAADATSSLEDLVESLRLQVSTYGESERSIALARIAQEVKNGADKEAADNARRLTNEYYDLLEVTTAQEEQARSEAKAKREAAAAQREYEQSLDSLMGKLDPVGTEFERFARNSDLLREAFAEGDLTAQRFQGAMDALVQSFANAGEESAEQFFNPFEQAAGRVSSAVQNAIASGEWDTIGDAIGNTLASSISATIDTSITKSLSKDLTINSGVGQQLAAAFAGPMLGAVAGGAVQVAINELDDYFSDDWDPTGARQAANGTGTVLGDINAKSESIRRAVEGSEGGIGQLIGINQGMLNALRNLQTGISGASDRIARGSSGVNINSPGVQSGEDFFNDVTGGALPVFDQTLGLAFDFFDKATDVLTFGLVDLGDLLGGKSKRVDEGVQIIGGYLNDLIDETVVNAFATFRVKKNFLDDYDTKERTQRIGGDVERQFSAVFGSLFDTVLQAGLAIGYDEQAVLDSLNQGRIGTAKISLEGLSAGQQKAELEAYFSGVFDDMASGIFPFLEEFQSAGEGLGETLVRVANFVQVTDEAVNRLGLQFSELAGRDLVAASERLIETAGGMETFINSMQGFIGNFATDARQFELAQSDLTRSLKDTSLQLPATRQGYYDLLQAQDAATASGSENVALLLRLQGVADDYYTRLEDYQTEALRAQEEMILSQRELVSDSLRDAEEAARSVRDALSGLSVESEAFSQARRESAIASLRQMADAGVVRPGDSLSSALGTASTINANQFGSFEAYIREVAATGGLLSDLDAITQEQVTVEQRMLDTLDRQAKLLEEGNADQLAALTALQESVNQNTAVATASPTVVGVSSQTRSSSQSAESQSLLLEMREFKAQVQESLRSVAKHGQRTARILERLEIDGIEVRE